MGDMLNSVILNSSRPSKKMVIKWLMDICKALRSFHSAGQVHLGVRASNVYLNDKHAALLGSMSNAMTHYQVAHLHDISKMQVADLVPSYMVYWSPEHMNMRQLS